MGVLKLVYRFRLGRSGLNTMQVRVLSPITNLRMNLLLKINISKNLLAMNINLSLFNFNFY